VFEDGGVSGVKALGFYIWGLLSEEQDVQEDVLLYGL
jgi:hypothetical protein